MPARPIVGETGMVASNSAERATAERIFFIIGVSNGIGRGESATVGTSDYYYAGGPQRNQLWPMMASLLLFRRGALCEDLITHAEGVYASPNLACPPPKVQALHAPAHYNS